MRMNRIVTAIEEAIEKRCFLRALSLSLVVPNICTQYDYPEIYKGRKYIMDTRDKVQLMLSGMMKILEL